MGKEYMYLSVYADNISEGDLRLNTGHFQGGGLGDGRTGGQDVIASNFSCLQ